MSNTAANTKILDYTHTHVILILDESGSMSSIKKDTVGSLKQFIADQRGLPGECTVSFYTFSGQNRTIFENRNLKEIEEDVFDKYSPSGCTALNDAIGINVSNFVKTIEGKEKIPANVIVAILTDGEENSSRIYSTSDIKDIIKSLTTNVNEEEKETPCPVDKEDGIAVPPLPEGQTPAPIVNPFGRFSPVPKSFNINTKLKSYGIEYDFIYLGANIDSFAQSDRIGINNNLTANWCQDSIGIKAANQQISYHVAAKRMKGQNMALANNQLSQAAYDNNIANAAFGSQKLVAFCADDNDYENYFSKQRASIQRAECDRAAKKKF